jgi:hypothetical protein
LFSPVRAVSNGDAVSAVVGIDPGGRWTGVVARRFDAVVWAAVITREGDMASYLTEIKAAVGDAIATHLLAVDVTVAVEGLVKPTPHMGVISLTGLLDTAVVLGAVMAWWPSAVIVPPGDNGAGPLTAYPARLVGAREVKGEGIARHARSAWDVAGRAVLYRSVPR